MMSDLSDLTFQMLLQSHYSGDSNEVEESHAEILTEDSWQKLEIGNDSPGFDIFMYAILACQHMYFRMNAAEYGLILASSEGLITVIADEHRDIQTLNVEFKGKLISGTPNQDMVDSITARMKLCPVSINLKDIPHNNIIATFE